MNPADLSSTAPRGLRDKLRGLAEKLRRDDLTHQDKAVIFVHHALQALRLYPHIELSRHVMYELTEPPRVLRGLRDLVVRPGVEADIPALAFMAEEPDENMAERFRRGDLVFVGQLGGEVLAQSWFHRGPRAFAEDGERLAQWELDGTTYWSYAAMTTDAARASGLFVKVFQTALRDLFRERGAKRVQCRVRADNVSSLLLHERLGFQRLGTVAALNTPVGRVVRFHGAGGVRRWLVPRGAALRLPVPPLPPPMGWGRA